MWQKRILRNHEKKRARRVIGPSLSAVNVLRWLLVSVAISDHVATCILRLMDAVIWLQRVLQPGYNCYDLCYDALHAVPLELLWLGISSIYNDQLMHRPDSSMAMAPAFSKIPVAPLPNIPLISGLKCSHLD